MPIYEYKCCHCGKVFELLVRHKDIPVCPQCSSRELKKLLSMFNSHVGKGSRPSSSSCATCFGKTCSTCRS